MNRELFRQEFWEFIVLRLYVPELIIKKALVFRLINVHGII